MGNKSDEKSNHAYYFFAICKSVRCRGKIIVAAADPYPPFVDPSDPNEELSLAIIRAAYKIQGYTVKMEFVPWARAEAFKVEGKYDILPNTWMNEKRKQTLMYSEPYAVNNIKFI